MRFHCVSHVVSEGEGLEGLLYPLLVEEREVLSEAETLQPPLKTREGVLTGEEGGLEERREEGGKGREEGGKG